MKKIFTLLSSLILLTLQSFAQTGSNNELLADQGSRIIIQSNDINVTPLPLTFGDASVCVHSPGKIIKVSIYTVTGQKLYQQLFNDDVAKFSLMPYDIVPGEYILKVETELGLGIRRVQIK